MASLSGVFVMRKDVVRCLCIWCGFLFMWIQENESITLLWLYCIFVIGSIWFDLRFSFLLIALKRWWPVLLWKRFCIRYCPALWVMLLFLLIIFLVLVFCYWIWISLMNKAYSTLWSCSCIKVHENTFFKLYKNDWNDCEKKRGLVRVFSGCAVYPLTLFGFTFF